MPTDSKVREGGCLCGRVRFQVAGALGDVVACHCRSCRRQSGHFSAMLGVPIDAFTLLAGEGVIWYRSSESVQRGFCGQCGSKLFWRPDGGTRIAISAGAFDEPLGVRLSRHIFCAEQGDYYEIADGLSQSAEWPEKA